MKYVRISHYDPAWPRRYEEEAARVAAALGEPAAEIEHVGSTSVPGLDAKPTIDILVGVRDLAEIDDAAVSGMERLGYELRGEMGVPGRRYFRRGETYPREFNVHVVELGGRLWREGLAFRDFLRTHPGSADAYARLKRRLVSAPGGAELDRYAAGKADFIAETLERAGAGTD